MKGWKSGYWKEKNVEKAVGEGRNRREEEKGKNSEKFIIRTGEAEERVSEGMEKRIQEGKGSGEGSW